MNFPGSSVLGAARRGRARRGQAGQHRLTCRKASQFLHKPINTNQSIQGTYENNESQNHGH